LKKLFLRPLTTISDKKASFQKVSEKQRSESAKNQLKISLKSA